MIKNLKKYLISALWIIYVAPVAACPSDEVLSKITAFQNVFIGEIHGTVESPGFVKCVVDKKINMHAMSVIVSLELPQTAADMSSEFWNRSDSSQDGRSSQAMHELYVYLKDLDAQGVLTLRLDDGARNSPSEFANEIKELSTTNEIILYRGNAHSAKFAKDGMPVPLGAMVGPNFTHIFVTPGNGGEFWGCVISCGVQSYPAFGGQAIPHGFLVQGQRFNHDYLYFLETEVFTASPPWRPSN